MDWDPAHSHLLRFALKESNFTDTSILLCVAMTTPWNIMDQLQNWATLLHDHIDKLTLSAEETKKLQNESKYDINGTNGPPDYQFYKPIFGQKYKTICTEIFNLDLLLTDIRRWQAYVEPGDEPDTGSPSKRISRNMEQSFSERLAGPSDEPLLPLPEDTLTRNLGLDLIVVATKVRCLNSNTKD